MAGDIVVTQAALDAAKSTLKRATENAQQCAQDAKNTISQLEGEWKGAGASSYIDVVSEITQKMEQAATVYAEIAQKVEVYLANMINADQF